MIKDLKNIVSLLEEEIELAEQGDWETLLVKEQDRNKLVLKLDRETQKNMAFRNDEPEVIKNLLASINDLEEKLLLTTELAQTANRQALKQSQNQHKAAKTYGSI